MGIEKLREIYIHEDKTTREKSIMELNHPQEQHTYFQKNRNYNVETPR
jgi:hypothetical protein